MGRGTEKKKMMISNVHQGTRMMIL
ncbi:hypothetical protein ACMD2_26863 [Ananas comosus]|uniref:Uncharacterized protein n=1 Tax=Ananas comosus TaxID=4615 RepID=A0A199VM04_ANACO|nr:hypothetical protein ACMD2_26863 [Ananas comosus]